LKLKVSIMDAPTIFLPKRLLKIYLGIRVLLLFLLGL
jgi:hypothetical protein